MSKVSKHDTRHGETPQPATCSNCRVELSIATGEKFAARAERMMAQARIYSEAGNAEEAVTLLSQAEMELRMARLCERNATRSQVEARLAENGVGLSSDEIDTLIRFAEEVGEDPVEIARRTIPHPWSSEPLHHRSFDEACEGCGAQWVNGGEYMEHGDGCPFLAEYYGE